MSELDTEHNPTKILGRFDPADCIGLRMRLPGYADDEHWFPHRTTDASSLPPRHHFLPRTRTTLQELLEPSPSDLLYDQDGERIHIEFFVNEKSFRDKLKSFCFKNKTSSFVLSLVTLVLKLVTCVLYVLRVSMDNRNKVGCYGCVNTNILRNSTITGTYTPPTIYWLALVWVDRPLYIWKIQVIISIFSLLQSLILTCLRYKGNVWKVLTIYFFLELINTVPFIITLFWSPLRNLFIPVFLNCWLAQYTLETMTIRYQMSRISSILSQQVLTVVTTVLCLTFTSICGFQHIQRAGRMNISIFDSMYFVVVTLATVGYGDITPDMWLSRLYVVLMICVAFMVLPKQFEKLAYSWMERQRLGGTYSKTQSSDQHVVVCTTVIVADALLDFLNEFYAYKKLQDFSVVLLTPCDLDAAIRQILLLPVWSNKVVYIKGSCLRDSDLRRARMKEANACFMLGVDNTVDKTGADEHTILRCWAVKDFAPSVPQYVQIFHPENKVHVKFADVVVCEDEFKYAMLSNNCRCPGASTLVTLLLHASRGEEGQTCSEDWLRLYGKCSGNEIYDIPLGKSIIFSEYVGRNFTYTALHAHRKFGVVLIGVKSNHTARDCHIKLNPGPGHVMRETDICLYISITREESMNFTLMTNGGINSFSYKIKKLWRKLTGSVVRESPSGLNSASSKGFNRNVLLLASEAQAGNSKERMSEAFELGTSKLCEEEIVLDYPRIAPYLGTSPTLCHVLKEKRPLCCLELINSCKHASYKTVKDYHWKSSPIILAAHKASSAIYNFVVPLRAHHHSQNALNPIIILAEDTPDQSFLDAIAWFPLVYWIQGSITSLDDLLRAGIHLAGNVVVANKEALWNYDEEDLTDCNTIVAVQTIYKFFPNLNITTELSQSSNMRFMHFQARNAYALYLSEIEQSEKERGSNISFMFRLQFASGRVFSANMMDTLLYQTFLKTYVLGVIRLLLGIDQAPGSGYLTSITIDKKELGLETYGNLFTYLCATTGDIPICVHRTLYGVEDPRVFTMNVNDYNEVSYNISEKVEINNLIKTRMENLGLSPDEYEYEKDRRRSVSFVIINPDVDLPLEEDDIVFVIRQSRFKKFPTYSSYAKSPHDDGSVADDDSSYDDILHTPTRPSHRVRQEAEQELLFRY